MCLVALSWQQHPRHSLIVAANRDEFHARPTQAAHWWPDDANIVGGRDLIAGGTWLALHRNGRFATITNYRDAETPSRTFRSRGHLVHEFLTSRESPIDYLQAIDGEKYAGFNLLACDGKTLASGSNRADGARVLPPGLYGLSNALLDAPWHKVKRAKHALGSLIENDSVNDSALYRLLDDREKAPTKQIESDHLPFATAHAVSAPFIVLPDYGTRSSSIVRRSTDGEWHFSEREFDAGGKPQGTSSFQFREVER